MTLLDLDLGSAVALGGAFAGIVGWIVRQNTRLERCATIAAVDEKCREIAEQLERKASKSEVIEHSAALAEHRESIAVLRAELGALSKGIDSIRDDLRTLTARLERWMEPRP